jgi:hypothetical protein
VPVYQRSDLAGPLRQAEIVSGLSRAFLNLEALATGELRVDLETYRFAVVVNQDCDLEQDHAARALGSADKLLPSVLFLPAVPFEDLRAALDRDIWRRIAKNKDERYQFLQRVVAEDDAQNEGLPALGIDFKRCFTIPTDELLFRFREANAWRRTRLTTPWAEQLSSRFAYYYARVALPADHDLGA